MMAYVRDFGHILKMTKYAIESGKARPQVYSYDAFQTLDTAACLAGSGFATELIEVLSQKIVPIVPIVPIVVVATLRELEVLRLVTCEALSFKDAAVRLKLSKASIEKHMITLYKKWDVQTLMQAYNEAMKREIIDFPTLKGIV